MKKLFLVFLISLTTGCAIFKEPEVVYVYKRLPIDRPDRPKVPAMADSDLACLDIEGYYKRTGKVHPTYQKMIIRERIISKYVDILEAKIDSTHGDSK